MMSNTKHNFVKINNTKIHYVTAGSGDPLILIHGLGGSWVGFKENIKELSDHFKVFALDLPGFGDSEEFQGNHKIDNFVLFLEKFLNELNIKKANILGHSMGGIISFKFALKNPDRTDKLILVGAPFYFPRWFKYFWNAFLTLVKYTRFEWLIKRIHTSRWFVWSDFKYALFFDWKKIEYLEPILEMSRKARIKPFIEAGRDALQIEHRTLLRRLEFPTLIIEGEYDPIIRSIQKWVYLIPNHKFVVIPKTRHCMLMEKRENFNSIVLKFLNSSYF